MFAVTCNNQWKFFLAAIQIEHWTMWNHRSTTLLSSSQQQQQLFAGAENRMKWIQRLYHAIIRLCLIFRVTWDDDDDDAAAACWAKGGLMCFYCYCTVCVLCFGQHENQFKRKVMSIVKHKERHLSNERVNQPTFFFFPFSLDAIDSSSWVYCASFAVPSSNTTRPLSAIDVHVYQNTILE